MRRKRNSSLVCLLIALLSACSVQLPARAPGSAPFADATATPNYPAAQSDSVMATSQGSSSVASAPQVDTGRLPSELAPYAGALQPAFLSDMLNMTSATRYDIDLTIESDLQHVRGTQQVFYVNHSYDDLHEILLRLYPNTPYMGGHMEVSQVKVNGVSVTPVVYLQPTVGLSGTTGQPISDTSVLSLPLTSALMAGQSVMLSMTFEVSVPLHPSGGYRTFGIVNDVVALPDA